METLKFVVRKKKAGVNYSKAVRIGLDAYDILQDIAYKTGLSNTEVANRLIEFASNHVEIIEVEE